MNDSKHKCKCTKTVRRIKVTTYICDPKCVAKIMKKNSKLPQQSEHIIDDCQPPRSILGGKYWFSKALKNLFSSKYDEQGNIDKSKYELKSPASNVLQTKDDNLKKVSCLETKTTIL